MKRNLAQIPNYTCLETIVRSRRWPRRPVVSRDGGPGPFRRLDSLRLEVAKVGKKELFPAAGARGFEDADLRTFARGGLIGNGVFALFAHDIFVNGLATYHFAGREKAQGRDLARYDYEVSYLSSGYRVKSQFGEEQVAYRGSIWADPRTFEAVRIDVRADEIPPHLRYDDLHRLRDRAPRKLRRAPASEREDDGSRFRGQREPQPDRIHAL